MSNPMTHTKHRRTPWTALRCAGLAGLALTGCVVANVAGCGGGGGGNPITAPTTVGATILLLDSQGRPINGTVTLGGSTLTSTNGRAIFTGLTPGVLPLSFTVAGVVTNTRIVVTNESGQTFVAVPGQTNVSSNGIRISGRVLLNTPSDGAVRACSSSSSPVTAALLIRVRSLNLPGRPIVASQIRAVQNANGNGNFIIFTIPAPGTYRVEARPLNATGAQFTGSSASFTVIEGQTQQNLDICANLGNTGPTDGTPPPPPGTPTPDPNPSATPTVTTTPGAVNPTATAGGTPVATIVATPIPGTTGTPAIPTAVPNATPTAAATAVPTATATPGGAPTATATVAGAATATPTIDVPTPG